MYIYVSILIYSGHNIYNGKPADTTYVCAAVVIVLYKPHILHYHTLFNTFLKQFDWFLWVTIHASYSDP